jgi:hypothetical protein
MTNAQKIDVITDAFIRALIQNKLDRKGYAEILRRVRALVRVELKWRERRDWEGEMTRMWGPSCN